MRILDLDDEQNETQEVTQRFALSENVVGNTFIYLEDMCKEKTQFIRQRVENAIIGNLKSTMSTLFAEKMHVVDKPTAYPSGQKKMNLQWTFSSLKSSPEVRRESSGGGESWN